YKARYVGYNNDPDVWWLRSGDYDCDTAACTVAVSGNKVRFDYVGEGEYAVRPSFCFNLA
ncbi:MAG: hypothetical protein IJA22_01670, partial [Clostridia bacterium]|nr:hypothetical protein [Clostridia bacterium]